MERVNELLARASLQLSGQRGLRSSAGSGDTRDRAASRGDDDFSISTESTSDKPVVTSGSRFLKKPPGASSLPTAVTQSAQLVGRAGLGQTAPAHRGTPPSPLATRPRSAPRKDIQVMRLDSPETPSPPRDDDDSDEHDHVGVQHQMLRLLDTNTGGSGQLAGQGPPQFGPRPPSRPQSALTVASSRPTSAMTIPTDDSRPVTRAGAPARSLSRQSTVESRPASVSSRPASVASRVAAAPQEREKSLELDDLMDVNDLLGRRTSSPSESRPRSAGSSMTRPRSSGSRPRSGGSLGRPGSSGRPESAMSRDYSAQYSTDVDFDEDAEDEQSSAPTSQAATLPTTRPQHRSPSPRTLTPPAAVPPPKRYHRRSTVAAGDVSNRGAQTDVTYDWPQLYKLSEHQPLLTKVVNNAAISQLSSHHIHLAALYSRLRLELSAVTGRLQTGPEPQWEKTRDYVTLENTTEMIRDAKARRHTSFS